MSDYRASELPYHACIIIIDNKPHILKSYQIGYLAQATIERSRGGLTNKNFQDCVQSC